MKEGTTKLIPDFVAYENQPLRGLFWLSKEIFDDELRQSTNPDARELHDLRNQLEHKYLQVHESWAPARIAPCGGSGGLGKSISSNEMEAKTLRVFKIARSALCSLSLAIGREEQLRAEAIQKA